MRKFITSNFELDLTNFQTSTQEENHWFSDRFFAKYTLPFDIDLDEEIDEALGFISFYNSKDFETLFEGYFYENGERYKAVFEVEEHMELLQCSIRFGFEEFPSFTKKLSELSLEKTEVLNIYNHASGVIALGWPEINYNFPQVHIDKIENEDQPWSAFNKIINNYKDGAFLTNYVDENLQIVYNRNIMQPMPYMLHIIRRGLIDGGYELEGDILDNELIKKLLIYADVEYYKILETDPLDLVVWSEDAIEEVYVPAVSPANPYTWQKYLKTVQLPHAGRYQIIGVIQVRIFAYGIPQTATYRITYRGQVLKQWSYTNIVSNQTFFFLQVNETFNTQFDLNPHEIKFESFQSYTQGFKIAGLEIIPIRFFNAEGDYLPTVINPDIVDLARAVPDMTFGDFFTTYKNYFNWSIDISGNVMTINFVKDQMKNQPVKDMREFEIKRPRRKFNKGMSFLLKFEDVESTVYKYDPVFHNVSGIVSSSYVTDEKTNEIPINALPLPQLYRNEVQTAHAFDSDTSKIFMMLYDGMQNGLNLTISSSPLLLPSIHEVYHKSWFDFRIGAQNFSWPFKCFPEDIIGLRAKGKIFAYGLEFIVKSLSKTQLPGNVLEIEIEAETSLK